MLFEIETIDHIVLRTSQLPEMLSFYTQVLACSIERETPKEVGLTQLRAGSALIDIVTVDSQLGRMGGEAPGATGNNLDHFCLRLKKITEVELRQYLVQQGVDVGEFAERNGAQGYGQSIYLKDPDGNTVELRSSL